MKIRIREGNDFDVVWAIKRAGVPEDLSTAINMKLTLVVYGLVIEHNLFTVADNLLSINIPKEVATVNGDYRLIFEYTLPDAGQPDGDLKCKTDVVPFRIVPFTAKADDIYTINVTSDIAFGFKGDKGDDGDDAYQIWLDLGNEGTYEDFIAYLRQPAVDAGSSISELEGVIQVSEGLRVSAENERDLAEGTRIQSEIERLAAEIIRQSNEANRIENEDTRVQDEAERISKENVRQSSEVDRVEAEGIRQSNEIDRIEAEGIRVQAEVERQITIQEAVTATNLANEKANLANTAAQSATEAAGLADTARTELTTAVNTKLGEADDKIEEMDTTLSTYDGRVTQVESDISQLAGDVSLKEAKANKQNSLTADGTGEKFPTVDAVNAELRLTLTQQLANGDFSGGMTGWDEGITNQTQTVTDGVCKAVRLTASDIITVLRVTSESPLNDNAYYFARVRVLQEGATNISFVYAAINIAAQSSPVANQWYFISHTDSFTNARRIGVRAVYPTGEALAGYGIEVDYMGMINLTAIFGAGYEPTKSEMDILMQLIPNNYFEGTLSLTQKQTMNWVLKLIRQNRTAIISLGGTII